MRLLLLARGNLERRWKEDKKRGNRKRVEEEREMKKRGEEIEVDRDKVIVASSGKPRQTRERGQEKRKEKRKEDRGKE